MLKGLRELSEFALGIFFDLLELLQMLQVPVVASSRYGADTVKALQLSASVTIVLLIVWTGTSHPGTVDWITIGTISTIYFSFSAWMVHQYLSSSAQLAAQNDLKLDALSAVLTFNLLVILVATLLREANFYLLLAKPLGISSWDSSDLNRALLVLPVVVAGCVTLTNSLRYMRRGLQPQAGYGHIAAFVLLNMFLSDLYVYLIFVSRLQA